MDLDKIIILPGNYLDIMHVNICSIPQLYLVQDKDGLCFIDTYLDVNISNTCLNIKGYKSRLRNDRNSYGGCVMLYISKSACS